MLTLSLVKGAGEEVTVDLSELPFIDLRKGSDDLIILDHVYGLLQICDTLKIISVEFTSTTLHIS